jgi:hypothetical protein
VAEDPFPFNPYPFYWSHYVIGLASIFDWQIPCEQTFMRNDRDALASDKEVVEQDLSLAWQAVKPK